MSPLSIPSPPPEWRFFELGTWIHSWLPIWPENWVLPIHVYALAILVGIVVAIIVSNARLTARGAEPWIVVDLALWAVAGGIVGARIWHVLTHPDDYFAGQEWWKVFAVWEGGVAIFGAILGGALAVWIACRMIGMRFTAAADAIAPTLLLAQAFGRIGNYFNQELFGLPTDLPWGLQIDRPNPAIPVGIPDDAVFHPTFLYEILWNLAGFAILILIENRISFTRGADEVRTGLAKFLPFWPTFTRRSPWYWGKMVGLWAIWYGIGRVWFESIRLDPSETFLGIRSNVWGAFAAIVVGLLILIVQTKNHPGIEPSPYRPGKEWTPDSGVDSDAIYSDSDDSGEDAESTTAPATSGVSRT